MEGRATSATQLRTGNALKTPNLMKPSKRAATVSAAAVFKKQKIDTPQTLSNPRSPKKSTVKRSGKQKQEEEVHPLAIAFKETSEEYRRHLYSTAVTKINRDLDALLRRLYEGNTQAASSDINDDSKTSPLKLTIPEKYQRLVQKLCHPLSAYRYKLHRTSSTGEVEHAQTTLHDRFQAFKLHVKNEMKAVKDLQRQWEGVVAEMFQLGVACLGEHDIAALLSTAEGTNASSPAAKSEASLSASAKRKRVSFASPDFAGLFPEFLLQVSAIQREDVPVAPELCPKEVKQLENEVVALGKPHTKELQRLEKDHIEWWKRKQTQLVHSFMED